MRNVGIYTDVVPVLLSCHPETFSISFTNEGSPLLYFDFDFILKGCNNMLINTKYLGEIEISQEQILTFPQGLLGFESHHEFVLLSIPDNDHFKFLQDINNAHISFLLINPWDFFEDYQINLPKEELFKIGIQSNENKPNIYNIVTLGKVFQESTGNLLAPVVLNLIDKKGKQFVLNDTEYTTRHKLFTKELGE